MGGGDGAMHPGLITSSAPRLGLCILMQRHCSGAVRWLDLPAPARDQGMPFIHCSLLQFLRVFTTALPPILSNQCAQLAVDPGDDLLRCCSTVGSGRVAGPRRNARVWLRQPN